MNKMYVFLLNICLWSGMLAQELTDKLVLACQQGNTQEVRDLLIRGANVNGVYSDGFGGTPLIWAAAGRHEEICELLIANGADIMLADANGWTPLIWAAWLGADNICEILIQAREQLNEQIKTALLCLRRLKSSHQCAQLLYTHNEKLLAPYIGIYVPISRFLSMKNKENKTAYDYHQISCLNPEPCLEKFSCCVVL